MVEAASLPTAALTALNGLRTRAAVQAGERVLVNGASGGVGLAAVQIAKALGARVTAVCGAASVDLVRGLGADDVIDYRTTDFTKQSEAYDVIFDCIGNQPYTACGGVLRGRKVHVTTVPGPRTFVRMFANPLFGAKVFGLLTKGDGAELEYVRTLVDGGKLKPVIDKVFPMAEVAAAQEYSKAGRAKGKIVLEV